MKLLIVDDSAIVRRAIERHLRANGVTEVLQAPNGRVALELFREQRPDFVTMDITMPEMDGLACITAMTALNPKARIMVISALGDAETAIDAVERGANEYVFKPFNSVDLETALDNLLGVAR
jgi:two-component system chemotaxis response regulator CheY